MNITPAQKNTIIEKLTALNSFQLEHNIKYDVNSKIWNNIIDIIYINCDTNISNETKSTIATNLTSSITSRFWYSTADSIILHLRNLFRIY